MAQAASEFGLQTWYVPLVSPLLSMPKERWPLCCGGGCEPCAETLKAVAARVQELLG